MRKRALRLVFLGLSLSSSWGNGHATTYRALLKALHMRGHDILFLERDTAWYAAHRDLRKPSYCRLELYEDLGRLHRYRPEIAAADAVIVGSFVPDGIAVGEWAMAHARGITAFYDIDTPATLAAVDAGTCTYLLPEQIAAYDLYLSFTSGPTLHRLKSRYGARHVRPLYCSVDADIYRPHATARRWDLGYLGTYSRDRQPGLERLLLMPARRSPERRFVVAGAQYPASVRWPANVDHIAHVEPAQHAKFYSSLRWALNLTRADMMRAGYSPSVRLFEGAASGAPIIPDCWPGMEELFRPDEEIVAAAGTDDVLAALALPEVERKRIASSARRRVLAQHTSHRRAIEIERHLLAAIQGVGADDEDAVAQHA